MAANADEKNGVEKVELAQVAAAVAAVVGVVTSLAVTGVLSAAQRNHGVLMLTAFSFVLFGGLLWLIVGLFPEKATEANDSGPEKPAKKEEQKTGEEPIRKIEMRVVLPWTRVVAALAFPATIGAALAAYIRLQSGHEDP